MKIYNLDFINKFNIINIIIFIIWSIFIYLNWITYYRLIIFFIILFFIFFYKFIINYLKNNRFIISNKYIINLLMIINKYKNPLLLLIIYLEEKIFNILCIYKSKYLIYFFYILFLLIINPIKIFLYTYFTLLFRWCNKNYDTILFNRMLGLILSILIFTNIIYLIQYKLGINIFILIYLYFLIKSLFTEFYKRENIRFKKKNYREYFILIFLMMNFNTISIVGIKTTWSLISILLADNMRHNEQQFNSFLRNKNLSKIEKFYIHDTWNTLNTIKDYKDKPSFNFYRDLEDKLTTYMWRMDDYIIFKVKNWNLPNIQSYLSKKELNLENFFKIKKIYEYDYKIFKLYLFIYFDLEQYLDQIENSDVLSIFYIKKSYDFFYLEFIKENDEDEAYNRKIRDIEDFNKNIKNKSYFNLNLELNNLYIDIVDNYDLYIPVLSCINLYTNKEKELNEDLIFYQKINDILCDVKINILKRKYNITKGEYEKFLKELYEEWSFIGRKNKIYKYKDLLKEIDEDLKEIQKIKVE